MMRMIKRILLVNSLNLKVYKMMGFTGQLWFIFKTMMLYLVKWMSGLVYVTMFRDWVGKFNKNKEKFAKRLLVTITHQISVKFMITQLEMNKISKDKNGPALQSTHHMALQFQVSI